MTATAFKIDVPQAKLDLLHTKLDLTTLPGELEGSGWDYGVPLADMKRLVKKWKAFNWRKHEADLNAELPQFITQIEVDGFGPLDIHFVHKRSFQNAIPLLFVHGWPGSFLEVRKILPLLVQTSPDYPSFHVVAISLPCYGFSSAPVKRGFAIPQYAEVCNKLMLKLGYQEYVTQGGDWGALITRKMAGVYGPQYVKAMHSNMPIPPSLPSPSRPFSILRHLLSDYVPIPIPFLSSPYSAEDRASLERTQWYRTVANGYLVQQSTQPQTLGYALEDSPVGLLAWIWQRLHQWSDTDGYHWTDDDILTWVSIYYFSRAGPTASTRIYYEFMHLAPDLEKAFTMTEKCVIPMGHSYFPKEVLSFPKSWHNAPNLVFVAQHDKGGHFAAFEQPEKLVGDLRRMFGKGGKAFEVVEGMSGYAA